MGSYKINKKDLGCFANDDDIVCVFQGYAITARDIKKVYPGVKGVIITESDEKGMHFIPHKANNGNARKFEANYIPLKIASMSGVYCWPAEKYLIDAGIIKESFIRRLLIKPKLSYSKSDQIRMLGTIPEFANLPIEGEVSLTALYDAIIHRKQEEDLAIKEGRSLQTGETAKICRTFLGRENATRTPISDAAFMIYVMSDKKVNPLTQHLLGEGVCICNKKLIDHMYQFMRINKGE